MTGEHEMPSNEEIQVKKKIGNAIKAFGVHDDVHQDKLSLSLSLSTRTELIF